MEWVKVRSCFEMVRLQVGEHDGGHFQAETLDHLDRLTVK